jgi:hypothetical protein
MRHRISARSHFPLFSPQWSATLGATGTCRRMHITYVTTAEIAARMGGRTKRDTVAARLRAFGCTEYRFGLKTIRWDAAEVTEYERSVAIQPTAQLGVVASRPKTRGKTSGKRGAGGRRQRVAA